jgi:hypothetical protein
MRFWSTCGLPFLPRGVAPGVILGVGLLAVAGSPPAHAETRWDSTPAGRDPVIHVTAVLVVASPISKAAIATMQAEAEQIWRGYAVRIHWLPPRLPVGPGMNVVVIAAPDLRRCAPSRGNQPHTVGCFQDDGEGDALPLIMLFPERAHRLVGGWGASFLGRRPIDGWVERVTATLLGRALAHELGHFLLGPEHSVLGLMRAEFEVRDLLVHNPPALSLTERQIQRLTPRLADRQRPGKPAFARSGPAAPASTAAYSPPAGLSRTLGNDSSWRGVARPLYRPPLESRGLRKDNRRVRW